MSTYPTPPPAYTRITQGAFLAALSARLGDSGNVFWSLVELRLYLAEALRTWQCYTSWYRNRAALNLQAGENWYDLTATLTPSLLGYTVTDVYLGQVILYHLMEAQIANGAWQGTDQFSLAQVQGAIERRLNRFLGDTGLAISYVLQNLGTGASNGRAVIPTGTIDVRRVAYVDSTSGISTALWKSSEYELNAYLQGWWQTPGTPQVWSQSVTGPGVLQIAPTPADPGQLELLVVSPGPSVNLSGNGTVLNLPDDFSWGVKWGALADLLASDGQAKDPARAQYCEQRYLEAVQIAKVAPSVLQLQTNNGSAFIGSVFDMDAFAVGWENRTPGVPQTFGMAGRHLMAMAPAPSAAMTMTVDIVANMPIPINDAAYIVFPSDALPSLLDYTQHIASFKMMGGDFMSTLTQRQNMLAEAAEYNQRLRQLDFFNDAMRAPGLTQTAEQPRIETPLLTAYQPTNNG